jgi:predicted RNA binding protein YcfA (HicA-like mRNA interferase family)
MLASSYDLTPALISCRLHSDVFGKVTAESHGETLAWTSKTTHDFTGISLEQGYFRPNAKGSHATFRQTRFPGQGSEAGVRAQGSHRAACSVQRAACTVPIDFSAGAGKNRSLAVQERKSRDRIFEGISRARSTSQRHYADPALCIPGRSQSWLRSKSRRPRPRYLPWHTRGRVA